VASGWAAIAAAILTVTGFITIVAFFATRAQLLGALNDLATALLAIVTVPIALALYPAAARASAPLAAAAVAADLVGVVLAAAFSLTLVTGAMTFNATLTPVTVGNGLIGLWLALTAGLLLAASALPTPLGVLGLVGGLGLATTSFAFPALGGDHPVVTVAGLLSVIGLVGFYTWSGALLLQGDLAVP
jgi:hypothetical protein